MCYRYTKGPYLLCRVVWIGVVPQPLYPGEGPSPTPNLLMGRKPINNNQTLTGRADGQIRTVVTSLRERGVTIPPHLRYYIFLSFHVPLLYVLLYCLARTFLSESSLSFSMTHLPSFSRNKVNISYPFSAVGRSCASETRTHSDVINSYVSLPIGTPRNVFYKTK